MKFLDLGKKPISKKSPTGEDARFEPDYEVLTGEIEKLSSPTASGGVDWQKVSELSQKILGKQSKDLLVACYLSTALLHTDQLKGFAQGIHVIRDMLEKFWETLYPAKKRMRGRRNALEWWLERSTAALQSAKPEPLPSEEIDSMGQDLAALDDFLSEHMEDAPSLKRLQGLIGTLKAGAGPDQPAPVAPEAPEPEAASPPTPEPASEISAAKPPSTEPAGGIESEADIQRVLRDGLGKLREVAAQYMEQNLFHPLIFQLNRIVAWMPVEALPPNTGGKTRIPPPPQHLTSAMVTLSKGGNWMGLLETAEARVGEFLFWLDLSQLSAQSLEQLGHQNLYDVVCRETAAYTTRLKGLENLCFSDGTPFANDETKEWLKGISQTPGAGAPIDFSAAAEAGADALAAEISEAFSEAKKLVKKKKAGDAASLLHRNMCDTSSGKAKLLWRLALVQLLVGAKAERTALPYLEDILRDVDQYHLEGWDPDLAIQALIGAYTGYKSQKGDEFKGKVVELLDRVAGLNPAQAIQLGG